MERSEDTVVLTAPEGTPFPKVGEQPLAPWAPTDDQIELAIARSFGMRTYPIYGQYRTQDAFRVKSRSHPYVYHTVHFNHITKAVECSCPGFQHRLICPHAAAVVKRLKRRHEY